MKNRGEVVRAFLVAIATALITMLGVLLPQLNGSVSERWALIIGFTAIVLASMGLLIVIGSTFVHDYLEASQNLESDEILRKSVPTLVRFRTRRDVFTIRPDGRVTLHWQFEIEKGTRQRWTTLEFPVLAEERGFNATVSLEDPRPSFPVTVESVTVDGQDKASTAVLMFEERRSLIATRRHVDYSRLSVPVRLEEGRTRAMVEIRLTFELTDKAGSSANFAIIDVPYVTDDLYVEIRHQDPSCSVAPAVNTAGDVDDRPVLATSAMMGFTDSWESELESDNLIADRSRVVWRTHAPKLGYRYRVNYRVVGAPTTSQAQRPNREASRNGEQHSPSFSL